LAELYTRQIAETDNTKSVKQNASAGKKVEPLQKTQD